MTSRTKNIIKWSLAGLVGFIFIGSAMSKFFGGEQSIQMATSIGLSPDTFKILGLVELISAILFLVPRTGIIGTILLVAYMGGAIATHLTHDQSIVAPALIEVIILVAAGIRFPEFKQQLLQLKY